ncbi:hypothetical protein WAE56_20100 [Iodobacter sp. LRB]|uniref:hypothetical protein n=1 Tax=unclassified Iodobacter TaxID=235634 RepID=UPI001C558068|nr:hypothetical protein [Iodobacter sp. BJB302]
MQTLKLALIALLLSACTTATPPASKAPPSKAQSCALEGGEIKQGGIMGHSYCVKPYPDAGKTCRDSTDCQGKCLAELGTPQAEDGKQTGHCQANTLPFGCYAEVKNGNIGPGLCVD